MIDGTKEQNMPSNTGGINESGESSHAELRHENSEEGGVPPEIEGDMPGIEHRAIREAESEADSGGEMENRGDSSVPEEDTGRPDGGGEGELPGGVEAGALVFDEKSEELKHAVEAIIFASDQPVNARQISAIIAALTPRRIEQIIAVLNQEYRQTGRSFEIVRLGGGYQFVTLSDYFPWIKMLFKGRRKSRLSQAALETLAIVAYRQPVSKTTIEGIRGVNIDGVMQTLLERKLITIAGREKSPGRPLLYKTTDDFLQYFGLDDLDDLPNLREIEEIFNKREVPVVNEVEPLSGDEGDSGAEKSGDNNPEPEGDGQ